MSEPVSRPRVLITRSRDQSNALAELVREAGGEPVEVPVLAYRPPDDWVAVDAALTQLETYDWVCFTSANAVDGLVGRLAEVGRDPSSLARVSLAAVGPATADRLRTFGLEAALRPVRATALDLALALAPLVRPGQRALFPCGCPASDDLPAGLRARGVSVDQVVVYVATTDPELPARACAALAAGCRVVTLASSATVRHLLAALDPEARAGLRRLPAVCIGPRTAATARAEGMWVAAVAAEASTASLARAVAAVLEMRPRPGAEPEGPQASTGGGAPGAMAGENADVGGDASTGVTPRA